VELGLRAAAEVDPNDKALDYVRDGQHPSDPRKALYATRMECYQCVIEALGMFDALLDRATAAGNGESH
jgi:nuclear pore complex protein Nup155